MNITIWGSTNINKRGEQLLNFILESNLRIHLLLLIELDEVLDLIIRSTIFDERNGNWRMYSKPSLSDHRIIKFDIGGISIATIFSRNPK